MKKHIALIFLGCCLCLPRAKGQETVANDPEGKIVMGVMTKPWKVPATKSQGSLPQSVDNSTSIHFPPVFSQIGNSCAQASAIGYMFTYEMNSLLERDASLEENRFSYLYCWNFVNGGADEGGLSADGLGIAMSDGVMTESDFPRQSSAYLFRWASGFEKYLNAMKHRVRAYVRVELTSEQRLTEAKQYLYNKGIDGGKGGVFAFSAYSSGWTLNNYYSGPSETGYKSIMTSYPTDGSHGMTIVGYDDLVEFTAPDGKTTYGAFIAINTWGSYWCDNGRYYIPYWFFLNEHNHLALSNDLLGVEVEYRENPQIVFRIAVDYTSRDDLSFRLGVNGRSSDTAPLYDYPSTIMYNQGGDYPMQGQYEDSYIEFAADFSSHTNVLEGLEQPNFFLTVRRGFRGSVYGEGTMQAFSVYDYREDPDNPKIYTHESIAGTVINEGSNIFNIPTVEPARCSYTPVKWLNTLSGQPVAAPLVFRTAEGKYAKVRFSDYDRENGTIRIRYVYAPDGSRHLE